MRPPRIGIQCWLDDGRPSGARTRLLALLEGLRGVDAELELELLAGSRPDPRLAELAAGDPRLRLVSTGLCSGGTLARARAEARGLPALVVGLGLDLCDLASLPLPRLPVPCCLTLHDLRDLGSFARGIRGRLVHQELERALQRTARILVPSPTVADELLARWPRLRDRVDIVPAGLPALPRPLPRRRRAFVWIGRPEPRKRLGFALEAWSHARRLQPDLPPLVLVAPADAEAALLRLAQRHGDGVELRLGLDEAGKQAALAEAIALLFPSALEGFGLPAIEALRQGVPVLSPLGSAQAWVAGPGGLALPAEDLGAWSRALGEHARLVRLEPLALARAGELGAERAARAWLASWRRALTAAGCGPGAQTEAAGGGP